jgi:hypothetical protein
MSRLLLLGVLAVSYIGCAPTVPVGAQSQPTPSGPQAERPPPPDVAPPGEGRELAVYALSRGKGLPTETRAALTAARDLFAKLRESGQVLRVVEHTMGFEGERRVCAEFVDARAAAAARDQLLAQSGGTELFNIIMEACDRSSQKQGSY